MLAFFWLAQALVYYASSPMNNTLGFLSLNLAVLLITMSVTAVLGKPILAAFVTLAAIRYSLNGISDLTMSTGLQTASAILGLVIFALTLYGGLAFALEDVEHRTVLPLGRRGEAAEAFEGDLSEQVGPVEQEAGVRKQL